MALKNQAITVCYVAWNTGTNAGQTGDAANHTLKLVQDGTEASPTNSPSQVDATNLPGVYKLVLAAGDMNFNCVVLGGVSSTANVVIIPLVIVTERGVLPTVAPATSGGILTVGTGSGQLTPDGSGRVNVGQWLGTLVTAATAGIPDVNLKNIAGSALSTTTAQLGVNVVQYNAHTAITDANNYPSVNLVDIAGTASAGAAGYVGLDWSRVNAPTSTVSLTGTTVGTVILTDIAGSVSGNIAGSVFGSVGSVTGAVGSVTGNVGGNVVGSVGSVTGNVGGSVASIVNAPFKINTANGFEFAMFLSADHITPYIGGNVSGVRSIAGGTEAFVSGTITQIGTSNRYYFSGLAADFNGTSIGFVFSASAADTVVISLNTQP